MSQRSRGVAEQTAMLAGAGRPVTRLLVLNAASHGDTLDEVARAYVGAREMAGCVVTKVDEASRVAPALDTAIRYRLPVHFLSDGQRVPQDLKSCAPRELVDLALTRNTAARDLYAPTEADFAALMALVGGAARPLGQSASRRMRMLPRLLAREDGGHPSVEVLRETCEAVEAVPACMEAFELWRAWAGDAAAVDAAASSRHLLRRAVDAAASARAPLAILHGHARLALSESVRAELHAAVALDAAGGGLTVPALQLALAGSWQPIWGGPALAVPRAGTALLQRMDWLDRGAQGIRFIHVLHGMTSSLARTLAGAGQAWLASCPARTAIVFDGCAGPVSALASTLEFRPLAEGVIASTTGAPSDVAGPPAWVAHAPVGLSRRAGTDAMMTAILVRGGTGCGARVLYGLADARGLEAGVETLAALLQATVRTRDVFRHMRACWRLLTRAEPTTPPTLQKALVAAQMGVAVERAVCDEALAPALRGLAPTRTVTPAALSRLFTLKEMLEREETADA